MAGPVHRSTVASSTARPAARRGDALDELRTGCAGEPQDARRKVIELICRLVGARLGVFYKFGMVHGDPYPVSWMVETGTDLVFRRWVDERIRWPMGDPRWPNTGWNGRFVSMDQMVNPETEFYPTEFFRKLYEPLGLTDHLRLTAYHRGRHVGYVGVFRSTQDPRFGPAERRRLHPYVRGIVDALVNADAAESASSPEEGCDLVVNARGRVDLASTDTGVVLADPAFSAELQAWVRIADRGGDPPRILAGREVRWSRLYGAGRTRYLLHVDRPAPVRLGPGAGLSKTQREVASYAVGGANVREIASAMGISPNTVGTHLRLIYRLLGVGNRVELARALEQIPESPPPMCRSR